MGDTVKKIIIVLITIVVCVVVGAFIINVVAPQATNTLLEGVENGIKAATGIDFDLGSQDDLELGEDKLDAASGEADGYTGFQEEMGGADAGI